MTTREVEHEITIAAPPLTVYRLLAEVENWPRIFPPTIFVEKMDGDDTQERIRIWASANGEPKHWTSRRELDSEALRIVFRQEVTTPPVAAMSGTWIVEQLSPNESRVRLLHAYSAIDDDPHELLWIDQAVDKNSRSELAALKTNVEFAHATQEATFSFEDSVLVNGTAEDAYAFINDAHLWADRLPHVHTVHLTEETPGLQTLVMDTQAKDGSIHTTKSYRVTTPHHRISYKQITLPALLDHHTGTWTFHPTPHGVTVTSQHTVTIKTTNITNILGPRATLDDARKYVHTALSTNSQATLDHAKNHTENRQHP
ncbi:aromatase/cyclase [Streptomyces sp. H27-C3]|uniref:aromatase/cyclase n=1 Tax=Streptomyces sp. H27-C3 TaxID=3046305 RepID=UPI0024B9A068|nr:aromatase/cyclase [Streptomyces sp. H27-C3]MDJ0466254.1 aromatase/cyclase [Streptomyces sp. H27-C3]